MKLRKYKKDFTYSYCLGVFPTIELLEKIPDQVLFVALNSEGEENEGVQKIKRLCGRHHIPFETRNREIRMFAFKENTYAVAVFKKFESPIVKENNHVVLTGLRNMGNLGTILRSMVAFGFYDVAIIKPAADIFDPKVVSSAMGAFFQTRFQYYSNLQEYYKQNSIDGKRKLYTFVIKDAKSILDVKYEAPYSLVFGNEGAGLSESDAAMGQPVMIPQKGDVDSLNLSIAVGITLFDAVCKEG